jgi:hypothetical protein
MRLYTAFLGGPLSDGRIGEDHEVVFVVAESSVEARAAARDKWQGSGRGHVDAVVEVHMIDGYEIVPRQTTETGDRTELEGYN